MPEQVNMATALRYTANLPSGTYLRANLGSCRAALALLCPSATSRPVAGAAVKGMKQGVRAVG
jgi:hypothetical protein